MFTHNNMGMLLSQPSKEHPETKPDDIPTTDNPCEDINVVISIPNPEPEEPIYEFSIKSTSKKRFIYKKQYEEQINFTSNHPILISSCNANFNNEKSMFYRPPYPKPNTDEQQKPSFSLTTHTNRQRDFIRDYRQKRAEILKRQKQNENGNLPKLNLFEQDDELSNMKARNRKMQLKNSELSDQISAMYS